VTRCIYRVCCPINSICVQHPPSSFGRRSSRRHWNENRRLILIELNQLNHEFDISNLDFLDKSVQLFYSAKRRCGGKAFETRQAFARFLHKGIAHFAAMFWHHHYKHAAGAPSRLDNLILRIFQQYQDSFYTWVKLHNLDRPRETQVNFSLDSRRIASPVYYASLLGLDRVLHELINVCQEHASEGRDLINAQGGDYKATALLMPKNLLTNESGHWFGAFQRSLGLDHYSQEASDKSIEPRQFGECILYNYPKLYALASRCPIHLREHPGRH
jgi:hypothetical protein